MAIDEFILLICILVFLGFGFFVIFKTIYDRWKIERKIKKYFSKEANKIKADDLIYKPSTLHCFPCKCDRKEQCYHFWLTYHACETNRNNYTLWTPSDDHSDFCEYFDSIVAVGIVPD